MFKPKGLDLLKTHVFPYVSPCRLVNVHRRCGRIVLP